jgi:hypothetical protein
MLVELCPRAHTPGRHGDDMDIKAVEVSAGGSGDALEALSHGVGGVVLKTSLDMAKIKRYVMP